MVWVGWTYGARPPSPTSTATPFGMHCCTAPPLRSRGGEPGPGGWRSSLLDFPLGLVSCGVRGWVGTLAEPPPPLSSSVGKLICRCVTAYAPCCAGAYPGGVGQWWVWGCVGSAPPPPPGPIITQTGLNMMGVIGAEWTEVGGSRLLEGTGQPGGGGGDSTGPRTPTTPAPPPPPRGLRPTVSCQRLGLGLW